MVDPQVGQKKVSASPPVAVGLSNRVAWPVIVSFSLG
jgi:hypothetical protein